MFSVAQRLFFVFVHLKFTFLALCKSQIVRPQYVYPYNLHIYLVSKIYYDSVLWIGN
jgi:hypothetical protein